MKTPYQTRAGVALADLMRAAAALKRDFEAAMADDPAFVATSKTILCLLFASDDEFARFLRQTAQPWAKKNMLGISATHSEQPVGSRGRTKRIPGEYYIQITMP